MIKYCCKVKKYTGGLAGLGLTWTALLIAPKCPMCIAAWLGALSGVVISFNVAAKLRGAMVVICLLLALCLIYGCYKKPDPGPEPE